MMKLFVFAALIAVVNAQDPAQGWMAYAVGSIPSGVERITKLEMSWKVNSDPVPSGAFFSPWFGMDPADNLNLIQPVNPWLGNGWAMYTEYFQWSPEDNSNSPQRDVSAGQTLQGSLIYMAESDSYNLTQYVVETGAISHQVVQCQDGKKFTVPYVVYEKTFPCGDYPPDGAVNFQNIVVECDGKDCTDSVKWAARVEDPNCNMQAVIHSQTSISITWDTSAASKYDNFTRAELFDLNNNGWALHSDLERPAK